MTESCLWGEAVGELQPAPQVLEILDEVAKAHGLHECARGSGGELGFGAAPDAYAAVYIGKGGRMVIALSPDDAIPFASALGLSCSAKNDTTHYVRVPSDVLLDVAKAARVRDVLETALTRSWHGPRWNRGLDGSGSKKLVPTCPLHHYELATGNRWCMGCDDVAPSL